MQRYPTEGTARRVGPPRREERERPMTMLEAAIFFGVVSLIIDGIGAVIARATGFDYRLLICLSFFVNVFLLIAAGFVGARYTAVVNGVWAGIMVAALNSVFSQLIYLGVLPDYRAAMTAGAELQRAASGGVLAITIVLYVLIGAIGTIVGGAFFGFLGAAVSQLGPFRPRIEYVEDY